MKMVFKWYCLPFPGIYFAWFFSFCLLSFSTSTDVATVPILKVSSETLTTVQLVELSYQPLLVTEALTEATLAVLSPWQWALLPRWVDAAITFTTAFPAREYCNDNGGTCEGKVMSLRKFYKYPAERTAHAVTNITTHMGSSTNLPQFLADADFSFLDFTKTTLHHSRKGWSDHEDKMSSTSVMCSIEGSLKALFKPFHTSWDKLKCDEDSCNLEEEDVSTEEINLLVTITGDLNPRECIYIPQGWSWKLSAPEDATYLWLAWEEDLILLEDALDSLVLEVEDDIEGSGVQPDSVQQSANELKSSDQDQPQRVPGKLSDYLPTHLKKTPTLWSSATHIRHVINRYLLTERNLVDKDAFVAKLKSDRILCPHLVDCSGECDSAVRGIFHQLDVDDNGVLNADDADNLLPKTYRTLMHDLDDLVEELSDLAMDQWKGVAKGSKDSRQDFMGRARDRMDESGKSYLERWKRGDMDPEEEAKLKEHMPELYEEIMASRKQESPKDEL
ncbi:unnamed protein product [Meganyctiphanes norvegica]|uniref:EF-hand domain-containing protein n=1 Tax=Meganyctiphanes norvegica TaxID=48144 RepID=A0AAV2Q493_MEGNR